MLPIEGQRIVLRDSRLDDLESFASWLDPDQRWHALDGPYYPKLSREGIPAVIARRRETITAAEMPSPRKSLVVADLGADRLIGQVTWYWESQETNWLSVGIVLFDPSTWNTGLGYEALGLWGDYLLGTMPELARLDLRTWSGNVGMMRLAEKLGFREEARFRKARIVDGAYDDGMGYGILREEWNARYPEGFAAHLRGRR